MRLSSGWCWPALPGQLPLWLLQCLQRGQEPVGGLHRHLSAAANCAGHGGCNGLHIQASGAGEHEIPACARSEEL